LRRILPCISMRFAQNDTERRCNAIAAQLRRWRAELIG
jgi:hypothetical protein